MSLVYINILQIITFNGLFSNASNFTLSNTSLPFKAEFGAAAIFEDKLILLSGETFQFDEIYSIDIS